MFALNAPHGGVLVDRIAAPQQAEELRARACHLPHVALDARESADLALLAAGAASPLTGFLGLRDYRSVLDRMTLADGTPWPIPFTLSVTIADMATILRSAAAALYVGGRLAGVIEVKETFVRNPRDEAAALYGSDDPTHPGVAYLLSRPTGVIGGDVTVLPDEHARTRSGPVAPSQVRALARRDRWTRLAGLASSDGAGCLEGTGGLRNALLPAPRIALRHAPARDALLHAIVLKNHGAHDVYLDYERADLRAERHELAIEDLGVTPVWIVARCGAAAGGTTAARPHHRPSFEGRTLALAR
jgi:sulfate adenylyltransferase